MEKKRADVQRVKTTIFKISRRKIKRYNSK